MRVLFWRFVVFLHFVPGEEGVRFVVFVALGPGTFLQMSYASSDRRGSWRFSHPWFGTSVGTTVAAAGFSSTRLVSEGVDVDS